MVSRTPSLTCPVVSELRQSPRYLELISKARGDGAELLATLLTHVGWNKPEGFLSIHAGTSTVGRESFAAIGLPDTGPTDLPIREVLSRAARLAAEQGHTPLSLAISNYAAELWPTQEDMGANNAPIQPGPVDAQALLDHTRSATNTIPVRDQWGEATFNERQGSLRRWAKRQMVDTQMLLAVERALRHHGWHSADSMPEASAYPSSKGQPAREAKESVLAGVLPRECFNGWPADAGARTTTGEQAYACLLALQTAGAPSELMDPFIEAYGVTLPAEQLTSENVSLAIPNVASTEADELEDRANPPERESASEVAAVPARIGDRVELVPPEASAVIEYAVAPRSGEKARRDESQLVKQLEAWLTAEGRQVRRARIRPIGESNHLVTDTYDVDLKVLYEAKSSSDRATVRLAVGQLLDYLRFLPGAVGVVLLPDEPSYDLQAFVAACGLGVTYPSDGRWIQLPPPTDDGQRGT